MKPGRTTEAWQKFDSAARDHPLETLHVWKDLDNQFRKLREDLIFRAREDGLAWSSIGEALGCSRQAAWERYGYFDDELDDSPRRPRAVTGAFVRERRMRSDATGQGDDERYLRDMMATILVSGEVYRRSGVRTTRGADLNQIQTWVAKVVGNRHPGNARLIHNLRHGSLHETVLNVTVIIEPQDSI